MEELHEIFSSQKIDVIEIEKMLSKFKPLIKDIIFLVDMSKSMSGKKIMNAVSTVMKIYDVHINEYDRVSYMLFNNKTHKIFSLRSKCTFDAYFRNIIKKLPLTEGSTFLAEALHEAIKEFEENPFLMNQTCKELK